MVKGLKTLAGQERMNANCIGPEFDTNCIISAWFSFVRRKTAEGIRSKHDPNLIDVGFRNIVKELSGAMEKAIETASENARMIRIAYDTQEGSEARSWAEMMLAAWAGERGLE